MRLSLTTIVVIATLTSTGGCVRSWLCGSSSATKPALREVGAEDLSPTTVFFGDDIAARLGTLYKRQKSTAGTWERVSSVSIIQSVDCPAGPSSAVPDNNFAV